MKEKLKELSSWIPTVIIGVLALIIILFLLQPSDTEGEREQKDTASYIQNTFTTEAETQSDIPMSEGTEKETESLSEKGYILNKNSKKFHLASCKSGQKTKEQNRIYLSDRDEIISMGYDPCKVCNP